MAQSGFTGISYPFRVTSRGGCAMSTTSKIDPTHIEESIRQIFGTNHLERPMEGGDIYTTATMLLFEPNDDSLKQVLKKRMVEDLERLEQRIECGEDDIEFIVDTDNSDGTEYLYASITYKIIKYNTFFTSKIKVGEVIHE